MDSNTRLEILRLAVSSADPDESSTSIVARAAAFEKYVVDGAPAPAAPEPEMPVADEPAADQPAETVQPESPTEQPTT
jgi:hypothetical protein